MRKSVQPLLGLLLEIREGVESGGRRFLDGRIGNPVLLADASRQQVGLIQLYAHVRKGYQRRFVLLHSYLGAIFIGLQGRLVHQPGIRSAVHFAHSAPRPTVSRLRVLTIRQVRPFIELAGDASIAPRQSSSKCSNGQLATVTST